MHFYACSLFCSIDQLLSVFSIDFFFKKLVIRLSVLMDSFPVVLNLMQHS